MEQLNKIELRGTVGSAIMNTAGDRRVLHLDLVTNYVYRGKDGNPVIETTWHNCTIWEGKNMPPLDKIGKGDKLYVCGRLRSQRYTGTDGVERTAYEVLARTVQPVTDSEQLSMENNL